MSKITEFVKAIDQSKTRSFAWAYLDFKRGNRTEPFYKAHKVTYPVAAKVRRDIDNLLDEEERRVRKAYDY